MAVARITTPNNTVESFFITVPIFHAIVVNGDSVYSTGKFASIGRRDEPRQSHAMHATVRPPSNERFPPKRDVRRWPRSVGPSPPDAERRSPRAIPPEEGMAGDR